jgi:hypothetical protein
VDPIAQHGPLPHEETALAQDLLALARLFGGDVDLADHADAQQLCQDAGIDLVRLDLRFSDDAGFEGIGQGDVCRRHGLLKNLVKPVPVHGRLKDNTRVGPASHQGGEILGGMVLDASFAKTLSSGVKGMPDTVAFVVVDADEGGGGGDKCRGVGWGAHGIAMVANLVLALEAGKNAWPSTFHVA